MASEQIVAQLITEGASKFIKDFEQSALAINALNDRLQSTDRIRTTQLQGQLDTIRETITKLSTDGARGVDILSTSFENLAAKLNAVKQIRVSQLASDIEKLQASVSIVSRANIPSEVGALRNRANLVNVQNTLDPAIQLQQRQIQALAAAQRQAADAAAAHAQTLQGRLHAALNAVTNGLRTVTGQQTAATQAQVRATQATQQNAAALINQSSAQQGASRQGITYLSTLSAIHAASFLASNQTFTLLGSFFTLGAAFSRLGPLAVGAGTAFGGLLLVYNAIIQATQQLQQAFLGVVQTLGTVAAAATAAAIAAGGAGVKIAADVETQLGVIKAIERPTIERLTELNAKITEISLKFGISARDVAEAASLYVRAGGDIAQALSGGLEAVIQLQRASAGELQAAEAARAIAVGVRAFAKENATAADIANALTRAAQGSALSFTELSQAFQQAAPGAVALGIPLKDLAAVIATLGNNALRGTVAGTAFKQFLLDLVNPSKQSAKTMADLGINIADVNGKIRPLESILDDLSKALKDYEAVGEGAADATKAQAVAQIFGSRAALSANILIRESTEALRKFREETEGITAANVADTMLLPLNAQLERLKVTIQAVGQAFGGPLLNPIRQTISTAIDFLQQLIPLATLAGQAVAVILTDQGFGELQKKISEVADDPKIAVFLIELVNSFRNVRDVIVNQIVPAIQEFFTNLGLVASENGRLTDTVNAFNAINTAIQRTGAFIAVAIRAFSTLVTQIIHNEGEGAKLRDTISNLATVIVTNLVQGLILTVGTMTIALKFMESMGNVIRTLLLPNLASYADAIVNIANISEAIFQTLAAPWTNLARGVVFARRLIEGADLETALKDAADAASKVEGPLVGIALAPTRAIRGAAAAINTLATNAKEANTDINQLLSEAEANASATVKSFENLAGTIPDILSNLRAALAEELAAIEDQTTGPPGAPPPTVLDTKAIEAATKRIIELQNDLNRQLENLAQDSATKITNIVNKALERIGDINEKFERDLEKLKRDTKDKIDDIFESIRRRRDDRAEIDRERQRQDTITKIVDRAIDDQERAFNNSLELRRIARQRDTEDTQRQFDLVQQAAETAYSRQQAAAERAFSAAQQAQETALTTTQSAEEKALQDRLDREKIARQESQQLAAAKTPEERIKVTQDIFKARGERKFEADQQSQLDLLRKRHEEQRVAFQRSQEAAAIKFREGLEDAAAQRRIHNENVAISFRRLLENRERAIRESEEEITFQRRLAREVVIADLRTKLERDIRAIQDEQENRAARERAEQVRREEGQRRDDLIAEAERQRREVLDTVTQQLEEVQQQIDRTIRAALDKLADLEDSLPPEVVPAVRALLLGVQAGVAQRSQQVVDDLVTKMDVARATIGAQLAVTTPRQVNTAGLEIISRVILPDNYVGLITRGVFFALQQYNAAQDNDQPITINVPPASDPLNNLVPRR